MSEDRIAELESAIEALSNKNRELLGELKAAKAKAKGAEIDPEEYARLQHDLDETKSALEKAQKVGKSEMDKLMKQLGERDAALHGVLIDGGLTEALAKARVKPELMDAAKALLKSKAQIQADNGAYSALMDGKPLAEAVAEWVSGDQGKHFASALENTGGGAAGGGGNFVAPKGNLGGDRNQRVSALRQRFPELAQPS
jgi:chromosome segregation ATPase